MNKTVSERAGAGIRAEYEVREFKLVARAKAVGWSDDRINEALMAEGLDGLQRWVEAYEYHEAQGGEENGAR